MNNYNYSNFYVFSFKLDVLNPHEVAKEFLKGNLWIVGFETFLLLPFMLVAPGLLLNYMNTILSWVIWFMIILNLSCLGLVIVNSLKVKKSQDKPLQSLGNILGFYHGFGILVYLYILWGSRVAYSGFNVIGIFASLLMLGVFLFHFQLIFNSRIYTKATSNYNKVESE